MTVKEIMCAAAATCAPSSDLASVIETMRDHNCGFLPVVDARGAVVGVITDRDICLTIADTRRPIDRISAGEAMSSPAFSCFPDENLKIVLATMAIHRVRRLPVVDKHGRLAGVLSMDDVVLTPHHRGAPSPDEVVAALRTICAHPPVALVPE
jgi:CBS domain-containing protein